jgi:1,4-alpha-glucan branching enzyme
MLYLDYSRKEGEWIPNEHGGRENLEAIAFLKEFNHEIHSRHPGVDTIAEESTAFPGVTAPTFHGGLGFSQKWMMGWMHDTLDYFKRLPVFRRWHQNQVTFSTVYMHSERFMLPLSHDEVVHGKASLLYKMPGDEWQKFAQLRLLFGYQWMHPGSKLLFMGCEFGQTAEWSHDLGLHWALLEHDYHRQAQTWVRALNHFYSAHPALWHFAFQPEGWEWISGDDEQNSVMAFVRHGSQKDKPLVVVLHFQPNTLEKYQLGLPHGGEWNEVLNSDDKKWGGSGIVNEKALKAEPPGYHWKPFSMTIRLAPYGVQVFEGSAKRLKPVQAKRKKGAR